MRYIWLSLLMVLCSFPVWAQYQYSNNSFEKWDNNGEPTNWNSFQTAGGTLGSSVNNSEQLKSSTDCHSGSYSAQVMVRDVTFFGQHIAYANGMLTTGQISGNNATASSPKNNNVSNIDEGYAMTFTGLPDSMSVWLKSNYVSTSQCTRLHILLHDKKNVTDPNTDWNYVVAVAGANVPAKNGVWQRTSIPFYYKGESLKIDCDVDGKSTSQTHTPASSSTRPSYVLATIATNYMAGKGDAKDVLCVDDVLMIYNSSLKSLSVNEASVSGFSKTKYSYSVNSEYADGCVNCVSDGHGASVSGNYDATTALYTITVKGDDISVNPSNFHTYTIQFNLPRVYESLLTTLTVNGKSVSNFSSSTYAYSVTDASYASSTVDWKASSDATVEKSFDATTNVLTLTVKGGDYATDSKNTHTYKITFHASFESLLTSLKIDGSDMDNFTSDKFVYTASNKNFATSKVTFTTSPDASVEDSFDAATNILTLIVSGGDIATNVNNKHVYNIQFYASSLLADLKVDDVTIKGFDASESEYSVDVTYEFSKTEYTPVDKEAVVSSSYDDATATLTISVTGSDAERFPDNVHLYKVHYHMPYTSFLTSMTNNGVALEEFAGTKYDYVVDETYERSDIWYIADEFTMVTEAFDSTMNILTITVTGGDVEINPSNVHVYTIQFHAPYTSYLSDLKINDVTIEGFSPDMFDYVVDGVYFKVKLDVLTDDYASFDTKYDLEDYVLTIRVKSGDFALDPNNYHEYRIQFNDHNVYNSQMLSLSLNNLSWDSFDKDVYDYEIEGSYADISFTYTVDSLTAVEEDFDPVDNILNITVNGGNLDKDTTNFHIYHFSFTKQFSYGAQITAVINEGQIVDWFDKDTYEYSVDMEYNPSIFSYTTNSLAEVYEFFDEESLTLSVVVIGGDLDYSNMNQYIIHFTSATIPSPTDVKELVDEQVRVSCRGGIIVLHGKATKQIFFLYSMNCSLLRTGYFEDGNRAYVGDLPYGWYLLKVGDRTIRFYVGK